MKIMVMTALPLSRLSVPILGMRSAEDSGVRLFISPNRGNQGGDSEDHTLNDRELGIENPHLEISPVFTWMFSFPVWSVTLTLAGRLGSPMISIFLVGDWSVRGRVSITI